jgi:signal transduction histidine kinase
VNVLAISSLLATLVLLAIGVSVLLRDRTRKTYTSFAAFTFMVAAWHLCNFIAMVTAEAMVEWLALWPAATIPPVALQFFREFMADPSIGGKHRPPRTTLAWTFFAYMALIYSAIFQPIHTERWFLIPFGIYVYGGLYRCIWELYKQFRQTSSRVAKTRMRYLLTAGSVAITLALTEALPYFGDVGPTIGNVLTVLYLYFLSQTLFRYRLLDLNELVGKMIVLGVLVVLLWAVYGLLLAWLGSRQEGLWLLNSLVASFVILVLFEPIRNRLENTINGWLVRQRHELRGRIADVRRDLSDAVDLNDMTNRIMVGCEESRRVTHACMYLIDSDGAAYDRLAFMGPKSGTERFEVAQHNAFLDRIREGFIDAEVVATELRNLEGDSVQRERDELQSVLRSCEETETSILVPIFGTGETEQGRWLLGLLGFKDERLEGAFDLDDIDTFRRLADECGKAIETTQVYERVKDRERLAAIGEMAAGLAHEVRNPLGAIKGAAQLLVGPDGKPLENTAESAEWISIIIEEVDRLNNVVTQFLNYARPSKTEPVAYGNIDINEVVRKTVQLIETDDAAAQIDIDVRLDTLIPAVAGDPEQLRQVFLNLGLNALQSMHGPGRLEIITTRRRRSRLGYGSFAEVRFRDTGEGIAKDKLRSLFIPFYTTKQRGTGLGLAVSQRIVAQHNGVIEVRSTLGRGSTFSVFFPGLGPSLPADAAASEVAGKKRKNPSGSVTQPIEGFRANQSQRERVASTRAPDEDVIEPTGPGDEHVPVDMRDAPDDDSVSKPAPS